MKCDQCSKASDAPRFRDADDELWDGMPAGWLRRLRTFCGEIERDSTVCSQECAAALVAAEHAERDARAADHERRKAAGELTIYEKMSEITMRLYAEQLMRDRENWDKLASMPVGEIKFVGIGDEDDAT